MKSLFSLMLASVLFASAVSPATAQEKPQVLSADQLLQNLGSKEKAPLAEIILHVVSLSLGAANAELHINGRDPLFCVPANLALTPDQNRSIFEDYLERSPEMGEFPYFMIMLAALQDTFPCENKR